MQEEGVSPGARDHCSEEWQADWACKSGCPLREKGRVERELDNARQAGIH
jgi:hypothetical protein